MYSGRSFSHLAGGGKLRRLHHLHLHLHLGALFQKLPLVAELYQLAVLGLGWVGLGWGGQEAANGGHTVCTVVPTKS